MATLDDDIDCSLRNTSKSIALLMGDFNLPDICLEYHGHVKTAEMLLAIVGRKSVAFRKNIVHPQHSWALEPDSQGSDHNNKSESSRNLWVAFSATGCDSWGSVQGQELYAAILVGPFYLKILWVSVKSLATRGS